MNITETLDALHAQLLVQRRHAESVDSWLKPEYTPGFHPPRNAGKEHKQLADLARTPWLDLVVTNVAQAMYVSDVVSDDGVSDRILWGMWLDNGMASRQVANHRAMVAYGQTFGVVTPATLEGRYTTRMRCLSPKKMACKWEDPSGDVYPLYALEDRGGNKFRFYTAEGIYTYVKDPSGGWTEVDQMVDHGQDYTPAVRFSNRLDLDGNVLGEVDPFIPTAARINKTSYDRLLAQHFNSWKVKTATGLDLPEVDPDNYATEAEAHAAEVEKANQLKIRLAQEDILIAESPDAKFGTLDSTSLDTFVSAWRSDIEALAAVSQTPAHALTGQLVNLSPEALAAARSPLTQKVYERQINAGQTYSRMLRISASMMGMQDKADDSMLRVKWQDMEIRSMGQAADALGKMATMLKIPVRGLWNRIPGVERTDVQAWENMVLADADGDPLNALLRRHSADTELDTTATEIEE